MLMFVWCIWNVFLCVCGGGELFWNLDSDSACLCPCRPRDRHRSSSPDPEFPDFDEGNTFMGHPDERTSTPFDLSINSASVSMADPQTQMKIEAMEEELAMLRQQIAQLVKVQEKPPAFPGW